MSTINPGGSGANDGLSPAMANLILLFAAHERTKQLRGKPHLSVICSYRVTDCLYHIPIAAFFTWVLHEMCGCSPYLALKEIDG
jgi:hypothetical protein